MGDTSDIKKGVVIRHQGDLFVVTSFQFVNPGKGQAFSKTKMKSISSGKTMEITYKSGENIDLVQVRRKTMQYLYNDGTMYSFMDKDSYETVEVNKDIVGDDAKFLKDGLDVICVFHEGGIVALDLPIKITYTVTRAPDAVKGDTASGNVTKVIELDNGLEINAPIFIKEGDQIVINSTTGEYDSRKS